MASTSVARTCTEPSEAQTSLTMAPAVTGAPGRSWPPTNSQEPTLQRVPSTVPAMPWPGELESPVTAWVVAPSAWQALTMPTAKGWVELASIESRALSARRRSALAGKTSKAATAGSPAVNVPVLSKQTQSTSARRSTAAPPRKRIPWRAPLAMAARTAEGTERTKAQGLSTTSNVMAR